MKKRSQLFIALIALTIITSTCMMAQKVGSTSMQFFKVMPVARANAMGDAYTVLGRGAEAIFWNPAGVAYTQGTELSMTYLQWIFDTQQGAMSISRSFRGFGSLGIQLQYIDYGEIEEAVWGDPYKNDLNTPGLTGRTFRPYSYVVGISYATKITDKFSTGLGVKYARESLYDKDEIVVVSDASDTAKVKTWGEDVLFDYGIHYLTGFRSIELAASVQNFGPNIKYAKENHPTPMIFRIGIAANFIGPDALLLKNEKNRMGVEFDLIHPNDYDQQIHVGLEYEFSKLVALRCGYKFNYDAEGLTAGLGLKQDIGGMRLAFDYSFASLKYHLGNVQRISLGVGF
ncbi:MAG TPA: PorV/PorQ family protein [Bacteroidota bacterium]|jgi:hypothetical protein|nr:PorV/PorQ family protein [Bacteroidota bacterium]